MNRRAISWLLLIISVLVSGALISWGTLILKVYGFGIFVIIPLFQGIAAVLILRIERRQTLRECIHVACFANVLLGLVALFSMEGAICLVMTAPLALVLAVLGGIVGFHLQPDAPSGRTKSYLACLGLALPVFLVAEAAPSPEPPMYEVSTMILIDASLEEVWRHVVSFSELPEPKDWVFKTGIAYPTRAEIRGEGIGSVRYCFFSTGAFVEPIEVWDPPRRLGFAVTENPPPMRELNPFGEVNPPHLEGFMVSERGEFALESMPDGSTRLKGTTWYRHGLRPAAYWKLWSDFIIHRIHLRVLRHIRTLSEASRDSASRPPSSSADVL